MTMVLPVILILVMDYFLWRLYKTNDLFPLACVGTILGGGAGNLVDRVMQGFVVDMFDFRVFPVFNVADIAVTCGCALLLIYVYRSERNAARKAADVAATPEQDNETDNGTAEQPEH